MPNSSMIIESKNKMKNEPITRKFIDIKPILIPDKDKQRLKRYLDYIKKQVPQSSSLPKAQEEAMKAIRYRCLKKVTGVCTCCSELAQYFVNYDISDGATLSYRYCSRCLEEEKKNGKIETKKVNLPVFQESHKPYLH